MTDDATIVPLADAHIDGFRAAADGIARERRYIAMLEAPSFDDCRAYVLDMRRRGFPQYVAVRDARVIGWCDISPVHRPVHAHCGILGIGVIAGHRGHGLGGRLLAATLRRAREIGVTRVELEVRAANTPAIALYERYGFVREGLKKNAVRIDSEYEDVVSMALLF